MMLAVDIGNSNVVFGLYDNGWQEVWRLRTRDETQQILVRSLNKHLSEGTITHIGISSVVPVFTDIVKRQLETHLKKKCFIIDHNTYEKLPIKVLRPEQIGADLVCNAVAAYDRFKENCIVVDFGTALTFTVISDREIKGVNIAPGLKTAMHALSIDTAKLHEIKLELPKSVIGYDTTSAIQSGILWGYVGMVEKMIDRIEEELGKKLQVMATGGLSKVLDPLHERFAAVDANLTLEGIRLIQQLNA